MYKCVRVCVCVNGKREREEGRRGRPGGIRTFVRANGTEKTVDRSIVLEPIADVVKLELVADSIFIGRHWSSNGRSLLDAPIRCDCRRIDGKTFRVTFLLRCIVRRKCNEAGLNRGRSKNSTFPRFPFFFFFFLFFSSFPL